MNPTMRMDAIALAAQVFEYLGDVMDAKRAGGAGACETSGAKRRLLGTDGQRDVRRRL